MRPLTVKTILLATVLAIGCSPAIAADCDQPRANTLSVPNPILASGSDLDSDYLSPNALTLANQLGVTEHFAGLPVLREHAQSGDLADRLAYAETREHISEVLRGAEMDVNYVLAEIFDEEALYNERLGSFTAERDKTIALTNAISFAANGALWAVCESLAIPTVTRPKFAISSGVTGIMAGIIPSVASALTLKEIRGPKHSEVAAPNMLAKIFGRTATPELDYPDVVWKFLDAKPADNPNKKRRDLIVDRWIADANIAALTDKDCKAQIDTISSATDQKKGVTIAVLSARISMLSQLAAEIFKMNRLLDEMEMVLRGNKSLSAEQLSAVNKRPAE